jgi:hypothetical protein
MAEQGFPGCVGFVDGTYVVLRFCPTKDGETFFNRKSRYAYNIMLVCDNKKRIRYLVSGWPGSVDGNLHQCPRICMASFPHNNGFLQTAHMLLMSILYLFTVSQQLLMSKISASMGLLLRSVSE